MNRIKKQYESSKNGIIFTLIFHIVVFIFLNISQFRIKQEFSEAELVIDLPLEAEIKEAPIPEQDNSSNRMTTSRRTNLASNKAIQNEQDNFEKNLQEEIEAARNLTKDVSRQLSKEIPTIEDLEMPEETTEGMDPDSILKKLYTGESNIEYFLEDRYHHKLPIPVYLTQYEGLVRVEILVNRQGHVVKANPVQDGSATELQLTYAKTAALRTIFNQSNEAPRLQSGYIQYIFQAQ